MHRRLTPWLTEGAIDFLAAYLDHGMAVLEFGAGGSSIWMAPRCTLTTVEHDPMWLDRVAAEIDVTTWTRVLHPLPYHSHHIIGRPYDLVLVDGRGRVECAKAVVDQIKPGGVLMLDNAERGHYAEVGVMCAGWNVTSSIQRQPDAEQFMYEDWTTTWWRKPR